MAEIFVVDVHSGFFVYTEDPSPYILEKKTKTGRQSKKYRADHIPKGVGEIVASMTESDWTIVELRGTTRGKLKVSAWKHTVYNFLDEGFSEVHRWHLVATRTPGGYSDIKISISNTPETTTLKRLVWIQRQRFWVERIFEDAKSESGMADYQVRKWSAWPHHMALVMMALVFMLSEKRKHEDNYPPLSCADIEDLLAHFLPRRDLTRDEVICQMEELHRQRKKSIDSHTRRQRLLQIARAEY